jgi:excisionase family DNA binding protein
MTPRLAFSPTELAKSLRVSRGRIMQWIKSGRLRAVNISDATRPSYRVEADALREFLDSRAVKLRPRRSPTRRITTPTREEWF